MLKDTPVPILIYSDDLVIFCPKLRSFTIINCSILKYAKDFNLSINSNKTKWMVLQPKFDPPLDSNKRTFNFR